MKLLFDSSAIIEFFRNNQDAVQVVASADEIFTSSICAYEVLVGEMYREQKGLHSSSEKAKAFFEMRAVLEFNYADSVSAARIMSKLLLKGKKVDEFDVLIAAQALSRGATVLTKDSRHFDVLRDEFSLLVQIIK
jgi:predicted nucleic acid-binding protein